jgi:hypothetical protein
MPIQPTRASLSLSSHHAMTATKAGELHTNKTEAAMVVSSSEVIHVPK